MLENKHDKTSTIMLEENINKTRTLKEVFFSKILFVYICVNVKFREKYEGIEVRCVSGLLLSLRL